MKTACIKIGIIALMAGVLNAQNPGKLIIRNADNSYPGIIVSLNGIRLTNEYRSTVCYDYLDDSNYKVRILQSGSAKPLSFVVSCSPNYISKYILNKDNGGNYALVLESKSLMGSEEVFP